MYNWDDPINEALNKPEPVVPTATEKVDITSSDQISAESTDVLDQGYTGMENLEKGAGRIQLDDKAKINYRAYLNKLIPFKYDWAWQTYLSLIHI